MNEESIPRRLVEVYSKPDCTLCTLALLTIHAVRRRVPFDLVERDVREDPVLHHRWRYDIPVVCIDGEVAFRGRLTEEALELRLHQPKGAALG